MRVLAIVGKVLISFVIVFIGMVFLAFERVIFVNHFRMTDMWPMINVVSGIFVLWAIFWMLKKLFSGGSSGRKREAHED